MSKIYPYIGIGVVVIAIAALVYFLWPRSTVAPVNTGTNFGSGDVREGTVPVGNSSTDLPTVADNGSSAATEKIFKLLDGPVASAALIEVGRPTTTIARFVLADSGRVFDLPLDVPGAVPRAVSNTTIPGVDTVVWTAGDTGKGSVGDGALMQYIDNGTTKTLHLAFPPATTTLTTNAAVRIKFLPDGITSLAVSPDGRQVAYLVKSGTGSDGYIAKPDGTGSKKLFSLPLSQLILSWPSAGSILAQTPSAAAVPGVVFSINAATGVAEPIVYGQGLSAAADRSFSHVIYQTATANTRATYSRNVKTGLNTPLSFDPFPERCIWAGMTVLMYCATPLTYVPPNYLDLWHAGVTTAADSIFAFNTATGATRIIAAPGSSDGGEQSDIALMNVSPDYHYLVYVRKGDRSLWAVRLSQ